MTNNEIYAALSSRYKYHTSLTDGQKDEYLPGTCLIGAVNTNYETLVQALGDPEPGEHKIDWEWFIKFDDGLFCHVYNWKNGPNYLGESGLPSHMIFEWSIGSKDVTAVDRVKELLLAAVAIVTNGGTGD